MVKTVHLHQPMLIVRTDSGVIMPDESLTIDSTAEQPELSIEKYQEVIQLLATALEASFKGQPVRNGPHCFAYAEQLTAGSPYAFTRNAAKPVAVA